MSLDREIRLYVTRQFPLGPIDASHIQLKHREAWQFLFDGQNRIVDGFGNNPQVIVGRRGSGKTALLQSAALDPSFFVCVSLKVAETFEQMIKYVEKTTSGWLVETIADLWDVLLRAAILEQLCRKYPGAPELAGVRDCLGKLGLSKEPSIESGLWKIVNAISESAGDSSSGVISRVIQKLVGTGFELAREQAQIFMEVRHIRGAVLIDSLDGYDLSTHDFRRSFAGLLKCAGRFQPAQDGCDVRFCLPAELYNDIANEVSSAPVKDFSNRLLIRWESEELLSIAAHRIKALLLVFFPGIYDSVTHLNADRHPDAEQLFHTMFPHEITNRLKQREKTLTYLFRHTQLLPRHLLFLMTAIIRLHFDRRTGDPYALNNIVISESDVVAGVEEEEHTLVAEVFSGYRPKYPWLSDASDRLLPNLSTVFSAADLHKCFNRFAKAAPGVPDDYFGFQRALLEVGIIGLHTSQKQKYEEADFEYTLPQQLKANAQQVFCIHPLFSRIYRSSHPHPASPRPVYPRGTSWFDNE